MLLVSTTPDTVVDLSITMPVKPSITLTADVFGSGVTTEPDDVSMAAPGDQGWDTGMRNPLTLLNFWLTLWPEPGVVVAGAGEPVEGNQGGPDSSPPVSSPSVSSLFVSSPSISSPSVSSPSIYSPSVSSPSVSSSPVSVHGPGFLVVIPAISEGL